MTKINFVNGQPPALSENTLNQLQTNIENAISEIKLALHPIGSIEINVSGANPSTYIGGTWQQWGQGRVPVGVDTTDSDFNSVEKTGGEKKHKLTTAEMPKHKPNVGIYINNNVSGGDVYWFEPKGFASGNTGSSNSTKVSEVGGDQAHNNLQPYITCYMWKRTA